VTPLLRSVLFVPGTRPDRFGKAEASGADAVAVDLEDGVAPGRKPDARAAVGAWLASPRPSTSARIVRINAASTSELDDDLDWLRDVPAPDSIILPKAEEAWSVDRIGSVVPSASVIPLIETARGVLNAFAITGARTRLAAFALGAEDLTAEIGIPRTVDGDEILVARSQVVLAAATAGVPALDGILAEIADETRLRRDAGRARALGFGGKLAVHPSQVAVINDVFTPSADEAARARRIVEAYDEAIARGEGVVRVDDRMIDRPLVVRAQRVIDLFERIRAAKGR
jgi:citrate lyase beta subunit